MYEMYKSMRSSLRPTIMIVLLTLSAAAGAEEALEELEPIWMKITSDAPGNLFIEGEPVALKLTATRQGRDPKTGTWAAVNVAYTVKEADGDWTQSQDLGEFEASAARDMSVVLDGLPGPGLYEITVNAKASNGNTGTYATRLAVASDPGPPDAASPWGVFLIPYGGKPDAQKAADMAESMRRLGVSWVRLNFWEYAFENVEVVEGDAPKLHVDFEKWKTMSEALHERGISIMATLCHLPEALSSKPGVIGPQASDAGPLWARVMPRDLALWEQLMEETARQFPEITYWETWNEPNLPNRYWAGTRDEFATLVKHTVVGLKRGNPDAKIVFSGFTFGDGEREHPIPYADAVMGDGVAELIDVFSGHSLHDRPELVTAFRSLMKKHGLPEDTPLWDTEPKPIMPLGTWSLGIDKMFHFIHMALGPNYGAFSPLVGHDLTPTEAGLTYATAARLIGTRPLVSHVDEPTCRVYRFADDGRTTIAFKPLMRGIEGGSLTVYVPEASRESVEWVDRLGRVREAPLNDDGRLTIPIDAVGFVTAAGPLEVKDVTAPTLKPDPVQHVFEFRDGRETGPWNMRRPTGGGWIHDDVAGIWTRDEPAAGEPYAISLPLDVPEAGEYDIYISCDIWTRLQGARSISPWRWRLDETDWQDVTGEPKPMLWRKHGALHEANTPVRDDEVFFLGGQHVLQYLATTELTRGRHTFQIELTGRRQNPDNAYCIYFDAVVLRPKGATR